MKIITKLAPIKLIGIAVRTSNESEMNPHRGKIGLTMQKFFSTNMQAQIPERKNQGTVFAVYTNYESDTSGHYTYFLGEEVNNFENIPEGFETLTIPEQPYVKFTSEPGMMPAVCIDMWRDIWKMSSSDLGGKRAYIADFEIYDERSKDPKNSVLDIYIGIEI